VDRIRQVFHNFTSQGRRVFIPYLTAGDPSPSDSLKFMNLLAEAGAGIVELGIPFSDPIADGPVIQRAMNRALAAGTSIKDVFRCVEQFRTRYDTPVILMGYLNPVYAYGPLAFARDASQAGVTGVLMVDMPPEEADEFHGAFTAAGLTTIFLATPVTERERLRVLRRYARGFVYVVSVMGVTGEREQISSEIVKKIEDVKEATALPIALGFGISGPQIIREFFPIVDGFVVGSALIRRWEHASFNVAAWELTTFLKDMITACDGG